MTHQDGAAGPEFTIGQVARLSGTPATTLRFYERRGLIPSPTRRSGQRRYDAGVFPVLMVIRYCRIAGLGLDEIGVVLSDRSPGRTLTKQIALDQVDLIDAQIEQLKLARSMMEAAAACECPTADRCDCGAMAPVLERIRNQSAALDGPPRS